ncbi:hypothetical protein KL905_003846 [Ogataea polymorpha]|uniref:Vps72/YL1 C-terminal domain-containing protein n=2 Tax=Ogataea polymorpha TaxID=460523 RepID=A0A9P8P529_9ASCO|nr:hypothetical protein KL937_004055 [Ogataea polymorpha]KAG7890170.1 hypothetical protein KL908_004508 [Ogataea polymorpha]KAG7895446.1 hypothetical protein KL936_000154 [Ogataea polymorpha]KAG7898670.1 hypothetical protein KL935_004269 [Ogataea polymorpha]KAG7901635.1 hypothetical protein KL907_004305 [Ogataea polymorpha]
MSNIVEIADRLNSPLPFKSPSYKPAKRRYRFLRQILNDEAKRVQLKQQHAHDPNLVTYQSLSAPPSLRPTKTYCDITGLPTHYKSPHNQLRYYDKECYDIVKHMAPGVDQQYLALRSANVVLK